MFKEKDITVEGITIHTESFGDIKNPAIILIMGATAQGIMWEESFCDEVANNGFFVIRYDHRDTGRSTRIDYLKTPYTLRDLSIDVINILNAYEINKAHFVGASMGGFLIQYIALNFPERVNTLSFIMSSPNHLAFIEGFARRDTSHLMLPPLHPKILDYYEAILSLSSKSIEEDIQLHKDIWVNLAGTEYLLSTRISEGKIRKRLKNNKYIHNHCYALTNTESFENKLKNISQPVLIMHGEDDYILPIEHGIKLSKYFKNVNFIAISGMGHCFNTENFSLLLKNLINFIKINS